jgi:putative sigma-54 modulation protein
VRDKEADGEKASATLHPPTATSKPAKAGNSAKPAASVRKVARKQVYRVNHSDGNKPMTLEEAMLEMEASQDYLVYRDAQTDRVTVLMRRSDGHFDLIES